MRTYITSLDANFIIPTSVMLVSLDKNLSEQSKCIVMTSAQDSQQVQLALTTLTFRRLKLEFISLPEAKYEHSISMQGILHFSNAAANRLFASTIVHEDVDLIIYLDGDLMIRKPIKSNTFPDEIFSAMIEQKSNHNIFSSKSYFNSGVFATQLSFWRKNDIENRLIDFLRRNPNSIYKDQDALNFVFSSMNANPLSEDLNYIIQDHSPLGLRSSDPTIVHFAGPLKPWKLSTPGNKYVREWRSLSREINLHIPNDNVFRQFLKRFGYVLRLHRLIRFARILIFKIPFKQQKI